MKRLPLYSFLLLGISTVSVAIAHHSIPAHYDMSKLTTLKGTVTEYLYINPHAWIHVDVSDDAGNTQPYRIELVGAATLRRQGWTADMLQPGMEIEVYGGQHRQGRRFILGLSVTTPDGQEHWIAPEIRENPGIEERL